MVLTCIDVYWSRAAYCIEDASQMLFARRAPLHTSDLMSVCLLGAAKMDGRLRCGLATR